MPSIVLKTTAGVDFQTSGRVISLAGGGLINTVSDDELKELRANGLSHYIDSGYAIIDGKSERAKEDMIQEVKDKQDADIKANETKNNVKIKKD